RRPDDLEPGYRSAHGIPRGLWSARQLRQPPRAGHDGQPAGAARFDRPRSDDLASLPVSAPDQTSLAVKLGTSSAPEPKQERRPNDAGAPVTARMLDDDQLRTFDTEHIC